MSQLFPFRCSTWGGTCALSSTALEAGHRHYCALCVLAVWYHFSPASSIKAGRDHNVCSSCADIQEHPRRAGTRVPRRTRDRSNSRCSKQPEGRPKHGIFNIPHFGPDRILRSQSAVLASIVAKEGGVGGARNLERCDGKHGSDGGPCATCRPDPLIDPELAALAPSSWDLDTAANGDPGAPFVMVADVSRQLCSCGSSIEALVRHDGTRHHRGGQAVLFGERPVSVCVWNRSQLTVIGARQASRLCELGEQTAAP